MKKSTEPSPSAGRGWLTSLLYFLSHVAILLMLGWTLERWFENRLQVAHEKAGAGERAERAKYEGIVWSEIMLQQARPPKLLAPLPPPSKDVTDG